MATDHFLTTKSHYGSSQESIYQPSLAKVGSFSCEFLQRTEACDGSIDGNMFRRSEFDMDAGGWTGIVKHGEPTSRCLYYTTQDHIGSHRVQMDRVNLCKFQSFPVHRINDFEYFELPKMFVQLQIASSFHAKLYDPAESDWKKRLWPWMALVNLVPCYDMLFSWDVPPGKRLQKTMV